ncbi:MAG: class I SAM-dependent methyltransferase [bacterium]|nr:class I SAM-dependent methyltransferase [bacterium]
MLDRKVAKRIAKADQEFAEWLERNPGKAFSDFFVAKVGAKLDAGKPHATLGKKPKHEKDQEGWGRKPFQKLVEFGLEPHHVLVDYGCGGLRVGQYLMQYLEPGHYWGLDIARRFMDDGVDSLGPQVIAQQQPNLHVISPESVQAAGAAKPDFVICFAVLIHVPPDELDTFLDLFTTVIAENTTVYMTYKSAAEVMRFSPRSWAYPKQVISEAFGQRGCSVEFMSSDPSFHEGVETDIQRGWMRIERT